MDKVLDVRKRLKEYYNFYNKWAEPGLYITECYYDQTMDHLNQQIEHAEKHLNCPKILIFPLPVAQQEEQ